MQVSITTLGTGVAFSTWIIVRRNGICPSRAPAIKRREAVSSVPFTPPKVEQATKIGIIQERGPNILLAKVIATASEPSTSGIERVVWKDTMVRM